MSKIKKRKLTHDLDIVVRANLKNCAIYCRIYKPLYYRLDFFDGIRLRINDRAEIVLSLSHF